MIKTSETSTHKLNLAKILKTTKILLFFNIIFVILLTILNSIFIQNYFSQLLMLVYSSIVYVIILLFLLFFSVIPIIIGQKYYDWDEKKQTRVFFNFFTIFGIIIVSLTSIIIYFMVIPKLEKLFDPYNFLYSNDLLNAIFPIWWFFSLNVGILIFFLLYIYTELE